MSRFTAAYSVFLDRLREVVILNRVAGEQSDLPITGRNVTQMNAATRGCVVLLSSHIQGYVEQFSDLLIECIFSQNIKKSELADQFIFYFSRDLICEIKDTNDPKEVVNRIERLLKRDADIWSPNDTFSILPSQERFRLGFGNPTHGEIKKFLNRFGYEDYDQDLRNELGESYWAATNMIGSVVASRTKIAHGDVSEIPTPVDVAEMTQFSKAFCRSTDSVVARWFKARGCIIRHQTQ